MTLIQKIEFIVSTQSVTHSKNSLTFKETINITKTNFTIKLVHVRICYVWCNKEYYV